MWEYDWRMKSKAESGSEYTAFSNALRKVLSVSHSEIQQKLQAERKEKKPTPKRASSSDHASSDAD
jgi:hypothetical protein